jgi:hypothetical protein
MMRANSKAPNMSRRPAAPKGGSIASDVNPHAESMDPEAFRKAVQDHYGTKTLLIDKDFAELVLEYNTGNRAINRRKLSHLISQMKTGQFENTGEPVILSKEGVLNDGQHRLMAVVESEVTVELDVRFGIARKAFVKTDTGTSRSGGDVLAIRGVKGGTAVAPAVRLLLLMQRGLPESVREFVSVAEVDEAYSRWQGIEAVGRDLSALSFPRGIRSTPLLATAYMASVSPGKDRLAPWLETLSTGLATGKTDPAYVLRERLMRGVDAAVGTREGMLERFAMMILSWNAYAAGRPLPQREMRWTLGGKNPMPFPEVDGCKL